jgi:hypothetical protein
MACYFSWLCHGMGVHANVDTLNKIKTTSKARGKTHGCP